MYNQKRIDFFDTETESGDELQKELELVEITSDLFSAEEKEQHKIVKNRVYLGTIRRIN